MKKILADKIDFGNGISIITETSHHGSGRALGGGQNLGFLLSFNHLKEKFSIQVMVDMTDILLRLGKIWPFRLGINEMANMIQHGIQSIAIRMKLFKQQKNFKHGI